MRASDERRERTVAELRERALDGCLTLDTFGFRVDRAYRAQTVEELEALVEDLPRGWRVRARRFVRTLFSRPDPAVPPSLEIEVRLPVSRSAVTVGRSADCDVVVGEETVSRHHAELLHSPDDTWIVRDLGSLNGTWLNGSRVREARVCRGDVLSLGGLRMELRL
jgi:pSer/pThr/pTyr-binding forkhead associated (FHA) protein